MDYAGDVPMKFNYFEAAVTRPFLFWLLLPHEPFNESVATYSVEPAAVRAFKFALHSSEARQPRSGDAQITPAELPDLSRAVECTRVDFLQPWLFREIREHEGRQWSSRYAEGPHTDPHFGGAVLRVDALNPQIWM